jgi:FkbM family methyltransferase
MSLLRKWGHLIRFVIAGQDGVKGYPVGPGRWIVTGKNGPHRVRLRPETTDFAVFKHIFIDPAYSTRRLYFRDRLRERYEKILGNGRTPLIIDCGANNGCSALWFSLQFPKARIVALEPERENFAVLSENLSGTAITAMNKAVSNSDQELRVVAGGDETAFQTVAAGDGAPVAAVTIPEIVSQSDELFIVKIDIEGFEKELFASNTDWIDAADLIIIELHDYLFPGKANSRSFFDALSRSKPRDLVHRGENIFSFRIA